MGNDLIKIKEDAVKIQETDLNDTLKSIESENAKSSLSLILTSLFIVLFGDFGKLPLWFNIIFIVFSIGAIVVSLYNISAKKVSVHANVDEIFVKNTPTQWDEHLQNKHLFLRNSYREAKNLLYQKVNLTRISFILLLLNLILKLQKYTLIGL